MEYVRGEAIHCVNFGLHAAEKKKLKAILSLVTSCYTTAPEYLEYLWLSNMHQHPVGLLSEGGCRRPVVTVWCELNTCDEPKTTVVVQGFSGAGVNEKWMS